MARLVTAGFEFQDAQADGAITNGAATIDTAVKRTGAASLKSVGNQYWTFGSGLSGATTVYVRGYCYFTAWTTAASAGNYATVITSGGSLGGGVCVNKTGILAAAAADAVSPGTRLGTGSAQLDLLTWYRLETKIVFDASSHATSIEVARNGEIVSLWTGTSTATDGPHQWFFGDQWNSGGMTVNFDDIAINDTSGSDQNAYPGGGRVYTLRPTADPGTSSANWHKAGTATTNRHTSVDNIPPVYEAISDVVGNAEDYLIDGVTGASAALILTTPTYTAGGVTGKVKLLQAVAVTGSSSATDTAGSLGISANPVVAQAAFTAYDNGIASATSTTWPRQVSAVSYNPVVVYGTAATMQLLKVTSAARLATTNAMGVLVETGDDRPHLPVRAQGPKGVIMYGGYR